MLSVAPLSQKEEDRLCELFDYPGPHACRRSKAVLLSSGSYSANQMVPLGGRSTGRWSGGTSLMQDLMHQGWFLA